MSFKIGPAETKCGFLAFIHEIDDKKIYGWRHCSWGSKHAGEWDLEGRYPNGNDAEKRMLSLVPNTKLTMASPLGKDEYKDSVVFWKDYAAKLEEELNSCKASMQEQLGIRYVDSYRDIVVFEYVESKKTFSIPYELGNRIYNLLSPIK